MSAHTQLSYIQIRPKFQSEIPKLISLTQTTVSRDSHISTLVSCLFSVTIYAAAHLLARRPSSVKSQANRCSRLLAKCRRLATLNYSVLGTRKSKVGAYWPVTTSHRFLSINFI